MHLTDKNVHPHVLKSIYQPEFIFPEGASKQRGRFELAFSQIGSSVMVLKELFTFILLSIVNVNLKICRQTGAGLGGIVGLYNGIVATNSEKQTGKVRRTQ